MLACLWDGYVRKSKYAVKIPTIAIGMPTVISYPSPHKEKTVFVTPCDIDVTVRRAARLIALAAELAVFPALGLESLKELSY